MSDLYCLILTDAERMEIMATLLHYASGTVHTEAIIERLQDCEPIGHVGTMEASELEYRAAAAARRGGDAGDD